MADDLNDDGVADIADVILALRGAVGVPTFTREFDPVPLARVGVFLETSG